MDQIFKIIEMFVGFSTAKSQISSKQLVETARKLIIITLISLGAMALFCVGIAIIFASIANQVEHPILIGASLAVISLIALVLCLRHKSWVKTEFEKEEPAVKAASPMEQALALLITDFVMERQAKRNNSESPTV